MKPSFKLEHRLGYRILRWVLLTALLAGIALSSAQIILDAQRVSQELDQRAHQTLALVQDAATQAVYSIDEELARQVIDGLFEQEATQAAVIAHPDGDRLASRETDQLSARYRALTDPIFGQSRTYTVNLTKDQGGRPIVYGLLELRIDTAYAARLWLDRATLILLSGMARALILGMVLYLVYHLLLTRPLFRIIHSISHVDPERPGDQLLEPPKGHERDELGLWVSSTNQLLQSIAENQKKHQAAEARVSRLSRYDNLTGLPNREMFLDLLSGALEDARRQRQMLAVYCCGLDDFKTINEQYGYQKGDELLQVIADRLTDESSQRIFTAGRLGSDQFVIIEHQLKESYQAAATAEWLLQSLSQPARVGDQELAITATIGIALFPDDAYQPDRLLQKAEQSMTLAKTGGHNVFQFYVASVDQEIRDRKQLEKDLAQALPEGQFHLVFQPQINMESHRVVGAEALLRWNHPTRGLVPPDSFIPLAELNHSIIEIGEWVLDQACAQAAVWMAEGKPLRIAVNLSAVQLRQGNIVENVLSLLRKHELPPNRLELEVTETSFMQNLDDAIEKLTRLRDEGILIAVDDFGTGYSSLTYLKRLPVHHLKIDKQFIRDLLVHEDDTRIANTIIDLGRSLNLSVIAEGVETEEQSVYLRNRGCLLAQGYYYSKPTSADQFADFVTEFSAQTPSDIQF
ncbi:EAL domain-containing protein [Marinobacteraceae bacterium S3BR75-40.1]